MKTLNRIALGFLLSIAQVAAAAPDAGYYRIWQGFKRSDLSQTQFLNQLPDFMNSTVSLYTDSLNQYLVAIPPENKPDFVPDEFALVALSSEEAYKSIRATPAGQAYSDSHWQVFEKSNSKSLLREMQIPASLASGHAYDVIGGKNDWSSGTTTFFLGLRKSDVSTEQFLKRLSEHVQLVAKNLKPLGLRGYIVIADANYEVAYMNWESAEAMEHAFSISAGQEVAQDGATILDTLQWTPNVEFNGNSVNSNEFYKTK